MATPQASPSFDWKSLGFGITPVNGHAAITWKDGQWSAPAFITDPYMKLHVGGTALNYGQSCFEGLKAFRMRDGNIRIFRPQENAARMQISADTIMAPRVPEDLFLECVRLCVAENAEFVPPYGMGASMYLRPLLFGSGEELALHPPTEFTFLIWATPVAALYTSLRPVDALVIEDFDRAAPRGTGSSKLAGNYAPVFRHAAAAKKEGYEITLHLDSQTRTRIDEFSTSNFVAIQYSGDKTTFVVPDSPSILKSVTTKSLVDLASSFGWEVVRRPVLWTEVVSGAFDEVAACGTAAVCTQVGSITRKSTNEKVQIGNGEAGKGFTKLVMAYRALQNGDVEPAEIPAQCTEWLWPANGVMGAK
ncbi:hypothetical protein YB2330_004575 [Saitoella coloradoensis]